jgi:[lysine-biosynthesis-protein LysW]---L-2-aminoadipate ligase
MRVAMLHARMRVEERMLADALEARGAVVELVDLREEVFDLESPGRWASVEIVLDRSLSLTASSTAVRLLEHYGLRCVNSSHAIATCSDKLHTSLALLRAGVPTPRVMVATSTTPALAAIEAIGYPAVLKPTIGSWGRMVSRVNDRDAAEAVLEHRETLGSPAMHVYYVQEHIEKPGRDIRVFVVGGEPIAAITRTSEHRARRNGRRTRDRCCSCRHLASGRGCRPG